MTLNTILVVTHRWSGLAIAIFILITSLTGALLAFHKPIDSWLAPDFYAAGRSGVSLDAFELRQAALRQFPAARFDHLSLTQQPGSWSLNASFEARHTNSVWQLAFDPDTGAFIDARTHRGWPRSLKDVMPLILRVHADLAMPARIGTWILGISAIVWTVNCFIGCYLTMPKRRHAFFRLWKPSWQVKRKASGLRLHFDLHRALGLWFWGAMLIFAWSSVYQTLTYEVYQPVMRSLGFQFVVEEEMSAGGSVRDIAEPIVAFHEALGFAMRAVEQDAKKSGYVVEGPHAILLDRTRGVFSVTIRTSRDIGKNPETFVTIDASRGSVVAITFLRSASGDWASTWLGALHFASIGRTPLYPALVVLIGIAIIIMVVAGFVVWLKRRPRGSN